MKSFMTSGPYHFQLYLLSQSVSTLKGIYLLLFRSKYIFLRVDQSLEKVCRLDKQTGSHKNGGVQFYGAVQMACA